VALNTVFLARNLGLYEFGGEAVELKKAKGMAVILLEYYEHLAGQLGVSKSPLVRNALAEFRFETESAPTAQETMSAILYYGQLLHETIVKESRRRQEKEVLKIISSDPGVKDFVGRAEVVIRRSRDGKIEVVDQSGVLSSKTVSMLKEDPILQNLSSEMRIEISNGKISFLTLDLLEQRLRKLKAEALSLKARLEALESLAGFAPLEGEGVVIKVYDARKEEGESYIIHDSDLRDIVNELFAAGAIGIQIGGERLIVNSSIRCVGPVILVNHRPIAVDPVVIKAVGNPDVLASALKLIEQSLKLFDIKLEVKKEKRVRLVAYRD